MPSNFGIIVLAAGLSTRFGPEDKLMADLRGRPVITHVLDMARSLALSQRILVTRLDSPVADLAPDFTCVINHRPEDGMGGSIALAAAALSDVEACLVCLGDMPFVTAEACHAVMASFDNSIDVVAPVRAGQQGHPVLFGRACFEALPGLDGQAGARSLMTQFRLRTIEIDDTGGWIDLDTPDDFAPYR